MAEILHLKADAAEEDILSVIDRDAAVILDDVINTDSVSYTHLTLPTTLSV